MEWERTGKQRSQTSRQEMAWATSYDRDASGVREDLKVNSGEVLCPNSAWICEEMPEISSLLPGTMVTPFTRGRLG